MSYRSTRIGVFASAAFAVVMMVCGPVFGEDGYRLWLRYDKLADTSVVAYRSEIKSLIVTGNSPTLDAVRDELKQGIGGLLGADVAFSDDLNGSGAVIVGTPKSSVLIAGLKLERELSALGDEGFIIRSVKIKGRRATVIASIGETGVLYGAFHFLRLLQTLQPITALNISEKPRIQLRFLNHWDNLDGSIERGYAGKSLWNWDDLPDTVDPRYGIMHGQMPRSVLMPSI